MTGRRGSYSDWRRWWPALAAAVVFTLALGGALGLLLNQSAALERARADLAVLRAEKAALVEEVRRLQAGTGGQGTVAVRPWSAEGLVEQPRLAEYAPGARAAGLDPGTSQWRAAGLALPQRFAEPGVAGGRWESPGALLAALLSELGLADRLGLDVWETTTRVLFTQEDEATGVVLLWGLKDDAIAGTDLRVRLRRVPAGWMVTALEERHHCRRGVTGDGRGCS